jgi:RNA-binding protein
MKGFQKSYLRGLGQKIRPTINVGKKGLDEGFLAEIKQLFDQHELIKVKFGSFKDEKRQLAIKIGEATGSTPIGTVGHTALFYREHPEPAKREIRLPKPPPEATPTPPPAAPTPVEEPAPPPPEA